MKVTTTHIKKLREITSAPLIDCKKVLSATKGDFKKAEKILIKKGAEEFEKKKRAKNKNGIITSYIHGGGKIGVLLEFSCETDFVAKTPEFQNLAHELCLQIAAMDPKNIKALLKQLYIKDESMTVKDLMSSQAIKLKEKIEIRKFCRYEISASACSRRDG